LNSGATPPRPRLLALAWPLMAELVLGFGVALLGLWLASRESDTASAAFALSNNVLGAFFLLFRIISMGVSVVIHAGLGAGHVAGANLTARAPRSAPAPGSGLGAALVVAWARRPAAGNRARARRRWRRSARPTCRCSQLALLLDAWNASMVGRGARAPARPRRHVQHPRHASASPSCWALPHHGPLGLGLPGLRAGDGDQRAPSASASTCGCGSGGWALVPDVADWWRMRARACGQVLHIGLPGAAGDDRRTGWRCSRRWRWSAALGTDALATAQPNAGN
jgi:hypothetical protein